jgi:xanthine dehydrogenase YagT iron-sulfur-binding subunit
MSATVLPVSFAGTVTTRVRVHGRAMSVTHEPRVSLLDLLRERLQLTGTKKGCNEGACGVCTVLVDGRRVNGCMILAASCDGREVTTVEGLAGGFPRFPQCADAMPPH